jgi:hypothetical protein
MKTIIMLKVFASQNIKDSIFREFIAYNNKGDYHEIKINVFGIFVIY